jgi:hypothetical protein
VQHIFSTSRAELCAATNKHIGSQVFADLKTATGGDKPKPTNWTDLCMACKTASKDKEELRNTSGETHAKFLFVDSLHWRFGSGWHP